MRPELVQAAELLRRNTPEAVEEAIGLLQKTVFSFGMKVCGHPGKRPAPRLHAILTQEYLRRIGAPLLEASSATR
jgi:hypothetical protein